MVNSPTPEQDGFAGINKGMKEFVVHQVKGLKVYRNNKQDKAEERPVIHASQYDVAVKLEEDKFYLSCSSPSTTFSTCGSTGTTRQVVNGRRCVGLLTKNRYGNLNDIKFAHKASQITREYKNFLPTDCALLNSSAMV